MDSVHELLKHDLLAKAKSNAVIWININFALYYILHILPTCLSLFDYPRATFDGTHGNLQFHFENKTTEAGLATIFLTESVHFISLFWIMFSEHGWIDILQICKYDINHN